MKDENGKIETMVPTGFSYREIEAGNVFSSGDKDYNHLLFLLEGDLNVNYNEFCGQMIHEGEFALFPMSADVLCRALSDCRVLFFSFETLPEPFNVACRSYALKHDLVARTAFTTLPFISPLDDFFRLLLIFLRDGLDSPVMHQIKGEELFIFLRSFYDMNDLAPLFRPVVGVSSGFRVKVLRSYRHINNVGDFAKFLGMESKTFYRQFRAEFNESPYQWLLTQKARHIHFSLSENSLTLGEIRKKHGFKFSAHFTRFCKEQFHCTPLQLRKQLHKKQLI